MSIRNRTLVAVAGSGHSGSTLLSLLLSQHGRVFNLGQFRDLWLAWDWNPFCSCGRRLRSCPVYGRVAPRAAATAATADPVRLHALKTAFFQAADDLADWSEPSARDWLVAHHADYLGTLRSMLEEVAIRPHDDWRAGNLALRAMARALAWPHRRKRYSDYA